MTTNPDVNNNEQFLEWIFDNFDLRDAVMTVPDFVPELLEGYTNEWCDYCERKNTCPVCGVVSNGDQHIGDHGMCDNCFEHRDQDGQTVFFTRDVMNSEITNLLFGETDFLLVSAGTQGKLFFDGNRWVISIGGDSGYVYPKDSYGFEPLEEPDER